MSELAGVVYLLIKVFCYTTILLFLGVLCYWSFMNNSNYAVKKSIENQTAICERIQK